MHTKKFPKVDGAPPTAYWRWALREIRAHEGRMSAIVLASAIAGTWTFVSLKPPPIFQIDHYPSVSQPLAAPTSVNPTPRVTTQTLRQGKRKPVATAPVVTGSKAAVPVRPKTVSTASVRPTDPATSSAPVRPTSAPVTKTAAPGSPPPLPSPPGSGSASTTSTP